MLILPLINALRNAHLDILVTTLHISAHKIVHLNNMEIAQQENAKIVHRLVLYVIIQHSVQLVKEMLNWLLIICVIEHVILLIIFIMMVIVILTAQQELM